MCNSLMAWMPTLKWAVFNCFCCCCCCWLLSGSPVNTSWWDGRRTKKKRLHLRTYNWKQWSVLLDIWIHVASIQMNFFKKKKKNKTGGSSRNILNNNNNNDAPKMTEKTPNNSFCFELWKKKSQLGILMNPPCSFSMDSLAPWVTFSSSPVTFVFVIVVHHRLLATT